uniref:molybdopterin-dependent oxidoreductase n=1 Tax=Curtanaerobium respiraculi TaxID=2949669 RepID=UPI0024B357BD|nr:molybdopterin-dependent oxidoreductase [Curtanaerobium respiraculi]
MYVISKICISFCVKCACSFGETFGMDAHRMQRGDGRKEGEGEKKGGDCMAHLTMSRRSFLKTLAVTGAAAAVSSSITAPMQALAESESATAGELKHVRTCCRACGKVECGVWVTVQDGKAIKVEGDESAPQSRGHCCAKSQASMQAAYHPDRVRYPVKRTNPKGSDDPGWVRITLDEAFELTAQGLGEVVDKYGGQSVFVMCGTSRVWSLGPYQGMKQLFGTPNAHLAYQVCKGPRHWGGIMTDEMGSPWMEVEAEPKVYLQWGTAVEYSNYDTTNRTISDVAPHATWHIDVDPRVTPLGKECDTWINLRPGTDGALALGWFNWIIENEAYDDTMVRRWSNAPFLYCDDKPWLTAAKYVEGNGGIDSRTKLITEADLKEGGSPYRFMVWDENNQRLTYWDVESGKWEGETHKIPTTGSFIHHPLTGLVADAWLPDESTWADPADSAYDAYWDADNAKGAITNPLGLPKKPALFPGEVPVTLRDGVTYQCRTVWDAFHDLTSQYDWDTVEEITGVPPGKEHRGLGEVDDPRRPASRQRRHPFPAGDRPERQLHPELPRAADDELRDRQLRRARRQSGLLQKPVRRQSRALEHASGRALRRFRHHLVRSRLQLGSGGLLHAGFRAVPHRCRLPVGPTLRKQGSLRRGGHRHRQAHGRRHEAEPVLAQSQDRLHPQCRRSRCRAFPPKPLLGTMGRRELRVGRLLAGSRLE